MRIIAGEARGRTLFAPKGMETRPTADRTREALYNILSARVDGARVFDAFAGSGAMSLEAISRGARRALMSDVSRDACACMRRNVAACGFEDRARVCQGDWKRALAGAVADAGLWAPGAVAVLECARDAEIETGDRFEVYDRREYGAAQVLLCRMREA